tara:strand:- start:8928 stop:10187 length:1260 start_codon:yes stop_codon:yes gene_type:complete
MQLKDHEKHIKDLSSANNEPEWLLKKRLAAYEIFKSKQMPDFVYGLNINMNIDLDLDKIDVNNSGNSNLNIKNPDKNIIIEDFNGMLKNHENILKEKFMSIVNVNDKFTSFHNAFLNNLTFVYVPKNTEVKEPIELSSTVDSNTFDHLIVLAEDNTKFTLVENSNNKKSAIKNNSINKNNNQINENIISNNENTNNIYRSKIVELFIGNNCNVNYGNVQLLDNNTFNFTIKKASVGSNSILNWMDCCFGSKVTLSEVTTLLDGDGAQTNNHGIFFGNKNQQFDLVTTSIHNAPNTASDIFTKGALTGTSKGLYRGLVKINKNAPKSNGYQKEDTLLLSEDAQADSIPNLEIDNNDVRCTHGASIGRIDREKMFYLQSRGLNEEQATQEYVKGFFEPLIQKIQIKNLRDNMQKMVDERME